MKILKKAISLVLVFAMLASFAGMTGYKYSPMSIEAQAAAVGVATVHALPGGVTLTMADSLYKHNGTDYVMQYTDYYEDTNDDGKGDKKITASTATGDYGIPAGINDMRMKFVFSTAATSLDVRCSLTANPNWNNAVGYTVSNQTTWDRSEDTVMTDEYGSLYKHYLLDKGVGGFRDYSEIYWRFKYTVGGTEYIEYATVKLYDYANKGNEKTVQWSKAASTGTKPTDSQAAKNTAKFTVPYTVYYDSSLKIVSSTSTGDSVQEPIYIAVPENAKNVRLHCVGEGGEPRSYNGDEFCFFATADPASDSDNWKKTTIDSKTYYVRTQSVDDSVSFIDAYDYDKWCVSAPCDAVNGEYSLGILYRLEYDVEENVYNSSEKQTITYTQYAASNIAALPNAIELAWQFDIDIENDGLSKKNRTSLAAVIAMDMAPALATRGIYLYGAVRSGENNNDHANAALRFGEYESRTNLSATPHANTLVWYNFERLTSSRGQWVGGESAENDKVGSNRTLGSTVYYDPQVTSSIEIPVNLDFTDSNGYDPTVNLDVCSGVWGGWQNSGSGTKFTRDGIETTEVGTPGTTVGTAGNAVSINHNMVNSFAEKYYVDADDSKSLVVELIEGTEPTIDGIDYRSGDIPLKYRFHLDKATSSETTSWRAFYQFRRDGKNGTNNALMDCIADFHLDVIEVKRTNAHDIIDDAIKNNYVQAEMDSDWWDNYREEVFAAYLVCGNLQNGSDVDESTHQDNPKYAFADYSKLQEELLTLDGQKEAEAKAEAENIEVPPYGWDRGGPTDAWILANDSSADTDNDNKISATERKNAGYLNWGDNYAKYNQTTYNSGVTDRSPRAGAVANSLAAYDLKFINKQLFISDEIRTGEYYYSAASWAAYEDARFRAMNAYNYPVKAAKTAADYAGKQTSTTPVGYTHDYDTVKFDYNAAYPAKAAAVNADNGVGLACYCKAEIDAATLALAATRSALVKKEDANEYDELGNAYTYLVEAASAAAYDGEYKLHLYQETDVKGNIQNPKHGFAGIYNATSGKHNYQTASLYFRANHADDVFDYVWTEEEAAAYNEGKPSSEWVSSGTVHMENGVPMYKYEDGTVTTAEAAGDTGILSFPKEDGSRGPVGRGNTFPQLYFDNSTASNKAVENMRTALTNRLNWGKGGYNPYYPFLKMVQGAYKGDIDGVDEAQNTVTKMTEKNLIDEPQNWTWNEIEHKDDILRATYALLLVAPTVRLATNYREVEEILNNRDNDNKSNGEAFVPAYDIGGSMYIENSLNEVTIFHNSNADENYPYDSGVVTTYDGVTYNTSGKTWYTAETWEQFAVTRDELAALIFNGKNTGGQAGLIAEEYDTEEIKQPFDYKNQLAKTHYTYDVYYESSNQPIISGENTNNKFYTNGHYYNQIASNYEENLAVNGQAEVNRLVDNYKAWFNGDTTDGKELVLKKLNVYNPTDYPTTSADGRVESIIDQVNTKYAELLQTQDFYDFLPETADGKITGASLKTDVTMYYYDNKSDAYIKAEAQATAILAAAAYNSTDNLADKVVSFNNALNLFKTNYDLVTGAGQKVDVSSWDDIITHINTLAERPASNLITHGVLQSELAKLYKDVEYDKPVIDENGNEVKDENGETVTEKTKVSTEIAAAIAIFDNRNGNNSDGTPLYANKQDAVNDAVEMLFNALNRAAPSGKVVDAANESIAFVTKDDAQHQNMFKIYNYTSTARAGTSIYRSIFTDESIAILKDGGTVDGVEILGANDYLTMTYPMLSTYFEEVTDDETEVANLKGIYGTDEGGVLVKMKADTQYLTLAVAYAKSQLYSDVSTETVKSTQATSPTTGATVDVPYFTEASIAELEATIELAETAIAADYGYENQLEIDKLTYAIFEETEDSANYFFSMNAIGMWEEPYIWVTDDDGNLVKTNNWGSSENSNYTQALYGERLQAKYVGAEGYGLQDGPAYMDFLEAELSTPYTDENGNTVDNGAHWYADGDNKGWAILTEGKVSTTSKVFDTSWGAYASYYDIAYAKYLDSDNLTWKDQETINKNAADLKEKRDALKLDTSDFSDDPNYETATEFFQNSLAALTQKTDVTRYGYELVDVYDESDPTVLIGQEMQESDNPASTVKQSVYLYEGADEELEALIDQFWANYASDSPKAEVGSWGTEADPGDGYKLYMQLKGLIENEDGTSKLTLKTADHEDFKAGLEDLKANYIAGTWDGEHYTTNNLVLSDEQSAVLQTKLEAVQRLLTSDPATETLGGRIADYTNDIHTYTINTEAKDMKFASLMRGYLIEFMQLKYTSTAPAFYDGGATREFYIFNQTQVNTYINGSDGIDEFYYNTDGVWPTIYEVNNLKVEEKKKEGRYIITYPGCGVEWDDYSEEAAPTTSDLTPAGQDNIDPVDAKILAIFNKIGAFSSYYTDVFDFTNNYYTSPLAWISSNAFARSNGETLILADLEEGTSGSSKLTVEDIQLGLDENQNARTVEVNYDVNKNSNSSYWYSEGYDYYTNDANGRAYYLYGSTQDIYGSSNGSWFTDDTWSTLDNYINGTAAGSLKKSLSDSFGVNSVTNIQSIGSSSKEKYVIYVLDDIEDFGWDYSLTEDLEDAVNDLQKKINTAATNYYNNIRTLQLLPATLAYRQVEETYQAARWAQTVTWSTTVDTDHFIALTTSGDTLAPLKKTINGNEVTAARFYNTTPDFLTGLGEGNYAVIDGEYYSPSLPGQYAQSGNTNWDNLETFHSNFANANDANMITIDKAALVTAVDLSDADGYTVKATDSPMEQLIKYLYALELVEYDFTVLNEFVKAFLGNPDTDTLTDTALQTLTAKYYEEYGFTGTYYNAKFYTAESLKAVYDLLQTAGVIKNTVYEAAGQNDYVMDTTFNQDTHGGAFYDEPVYNGNAIGNVSIVALTRAIADQIKALKLAPAKTGNLNTAINEALNIIDYQTEIYVRDDDKWDAFIKKLYAGADGTGTRDNPAQGTALYVQKMCDINVDGYYTEAENQQVVDNAYNDLVSAIGDLNKKADKTAPKMTVLTGKDELEAFYTSENKKAPDATLTNADYLKEAEDGTTPNAATLLMANNGYSLLVYTNQLNPRIVITLKDIADIIDAAKGEKFEIAAVRTSGVNANIIYGRMNKDGAITEISAKTSVTTGSTFNGYENTDKTADSAIFAILAPTFVENPSKQTQQARYTIKAYDQAGLTNALDAKNNFVNKLYLGGNDTDGTDLTVIGDSKEITIHIHYHNSMSSDNNEGIKLDENGKLVETTPDISSVNRVPGAYFDGELTYDGYWRAGVVLQRRFSSMVRNWEFVSEVKNNQISGCAVSGYNDPNFGVLNTGSFYYVLDRTKDADIYEQYFGDKKTEKGIIDYAAASTAKQTMIDSMNEAKLTAMRESGRFYDYGQDIQWSQALGKKVNDGELIFVHIVDRWGNVVNRIMEVPNLDKIVPTVVSPTTGIVNIDENGGSGIGNINIWNGFTFEEMVAADYEIVDSQTQQLALKDGATSTVSCSRNVLTVSGLTPGGGYSIDVYDNAGNVKIVGTRASSDGSIQIKITDIENGVFDDAVSDGEEGAAIQQSAMFTLNGTDTVILNTGMESSIVNADIKGNVLADKTVMHTITTKDTVTQIKSVSADGQTEEWTKTKSFVTDNGDGTLTWIIPRKFTEGEHVYKVYAMVDGEYETFSAPCTITATTKTVVLTVKNAGPGRTVTVYSGAIEQKNSTFKSYVIPYGAEVKITAETTKEGSEFYYWFSNVNNRILNTSNVYSFTAVSNVNCSAQFTSDEMLNNNKKLVVYVNNAKNVIKAFDLADGDPYTVPAGPILPDYTFKGWNMTPEEVYASDKDVVVVEPIYELNASSTVTILEGNYTTTGAGTYVSENNKRPTVTISASKYDDDGAEFLYWFDVDTNEKVSFNRTYSFHCVKDTVLVPVYGDASTIVPAPIVRLTAVKYSALNGKVSFFAERSVPEEFIIHKTGIVVTRTESIGTNEEVFVVGGTATTSGESTNTANNGFYSANVDIATGQTVWARAYAICEDESGEIFEVYGPIASYTLK